MSSETPWRTGCIAISLVFMGTASCGGSKLVNEVPDPIVIEQPISRSSDRVLDAELNWVIARNRPGSWATDADWDEYVLSVRNDAVSNVRITAVAVFDSLENELATTSQRPNLVEQSKKSIKRYEVHGLEVEAGFGGDALIAAGAAAYVAGAATGIAVLTGSIAASGATTAAAVGAAALVAPAMIIGGTMRNMENNEIAEMIVERQANLPIILGPGETQIQHFFFPIAPSPRRIEMTYSISGDQKKLVIDTKSALRGLHLPQPGEEEE